MSQPAAPALFRSIVVGCDGSEQSLRAIELAEQLRDPHSGRLTLVNVFPFYRGFAAPVTPVLYAEWLRDASRDVLDAAAEHVSAGVPFDTKAYAAPSAAAGLNDVAEATHADLLILGPSHRGPLSRAGGRTTVQRLLHGAPCAIAVAANHQREFGAAPRILVAYDGTDEAVHARDVAYGIAAATGAAVDLCAVIEPVIYAPGYVPPAMPSELDEVREREANTSLLEAVASAPGTIAVTHRIAHGNPARTILHLAHPDAALIVAGSRGYGSLHRLMAGSVSRALLMNGDIPVLVTPRAACATAGADADAAVHTVG